MVAGWVGAADSSGGQNGCINGSAIGGLTCAYIGCLWADAPAMSIRSTVPAMLWWLFWLLVALLLIILAALVIHHFGGFDLTFHVGDFHFDLGVTGQH